MKSLLIPFVPLLRKNSETFNESDRTGIDQILGNAAVGHGFGEKIKELDRRLSMNGMSYSGWDETDRQQNIFTRFVLGA